MDEESIARMERIFAKIENLATRLAALEQQDSDDEMAPAVDDEEEEESVITSVKFERSQTRNLIYEIRLGFEGGGGVKLGISTDCCETGWFDVPECTKSLEKQFKVLVGKTYEGCSLITEDMEFRKKGPQEYDSYKPFSLEHSQGSIHFAVRCSSNGYYNNDIFIEHF